MIFHPFNKGQWKVPGLLGSWSTAADTFKKVFVFFFASSGLYFNFIPLVVVVVVEVVVVEVVVVEVVIVVVAAAAVVEET